MVILAVVLAFFGETMTDTPLSQVAPTSLDELFNKAPDKLTDAELDIIVNALRAERARWNTAEAKKKTEKKAAKADLNLSDLDLDL